jgi:D-3-phosphoglycerate dehydrogenase
MKVHLFEKTHRNAAERFRTAGFEVAEIPKSLAEDELMQALAGIDAVGIRSRTKVTAAVIAASSLKCIGCFGVGVDQVDRIAAAKAGIPIFNAPRGSTESVAELAIGNMLALLRRSFDAFQRMHAGEWKKSASGAHEAEGRVLGIIGYGAIGSRVSAIAEALGMRVIYFDVMERTPSGGAKAVSFEELLRSADVVSIHASKSPGGGTLIGKNELASMKPGTLLINVSRGSLVDLDAVAEALRAGVLGGAAIDVFPKEPETSDAPFTNPLQGLPNVILTPHIGGSTEEAQAKIGIEVADALIRYLTTGDMTGAVPPPSLQTV